MDLILPKFLFELIAVAFDLKKVNRTIINTILKKVFT